MNNQQHSVISTERLFQPYMDQKLALNSRIVMSPMARAFSPNGVPGADVALYYRRRAEHGVGLIITEGATIDHPAASSEPNIPHLYGKAALQGWSEVVQQVHDAGGKIFPQILHMGIVRPSGSQPHPEAESLSPSGLDMEGNQVSVPMTEAEITTVIQAYADAAANAQRIGFDGIELHGAHGFLIDQFFWKTTNMRTDRYGGDLQKRTQFAVELVEAVRAAVGPDFPIAMRISQWKMNDYQARLFDTPEQLEPFLHSLVNAGVDIFHCSTRRFWEPEFEGSDLGFAGWVKKLSGRTTITVGSVGMSNEPEADGAQHPGMDELMKRYDQQEFDLVAVGRALLGDPAWVAKMREGRLSEIQAFTPEALATLH
ncbi:12-oxophytodienoate reductase [Paenibacillus sp. PCH8]|uniref:NADH:flavin oxidoreductase n=1 Tax=Paenibacillus sp. PCH8 TaxID=2066524 RepID=UPI000CFA7C83|nr:NADH:flavin oxidoreductase [Paenibacillus sp. PCH8]PQP82272.1 12-oxophytodienoate reductase [Paenibacillus sp. PCH8]